MSLDYTTYVQAIQNLAVAPQSGNDANFQAIIPRAIEYAELRIYRDFDFLCTLASQVATLTGSSRNVALPSNVIVCQSANVITPVSATIPDNGTRNPLRRVGLDYVNAVWPSSTPPTTPSIPAVYAEIGTPTIGSVITAGSLNIVVGPAPDAAYTLEVIGTVRPSALSPSNPTTFISVNMPDLLVAASMIFISGYQRDFGAQTSDPQAAMSWSMQYDALKAGVLLEELRKKAASVEWSPYFPTPGANQARDRVTPQ